MTSDTGAALELSHVTRRFGSLVALDDVSLLVRSGTVHALLGENGAGKTTLMRIVYGMVRPDEGTIRIGGRVVSVHSPAGAIASGIGMVHQHFTLVPTMTVAENLALGGKGRSSARQAAAAVEEISRQTGFALNPAVRVEVLPVGAQQRVEIAKALARQARLLVLDEPTAVLAPPEVVELLAWLRGFVAAGNAAVLITHKLREALAVADDITVLRHGRVVLQTSSRDATEQSLTTAMLGAAPPNAPASPPRHQTGGRSVLFRAERLAVGEVTNASFEIAAGEIVGVIGVEGAGQRALLRALAGRVEVTAGTLDRPAAVGFIPEDRHEDAVMLARSLTENVALRGAGARQGRMNWPALRDTTEVLLATFDVRSSGAGASLRELSGGNQQKTVLARELSDLSAGEDADASLAMPMAVVAENPTRGLDVRATSAVHARLREARDRGAAVVLYSSDLDEVLALADRTLVVYAGTVRELGRDREAIGRAMLGLP
jgi:ABC-type uncharacterized transport system ATPase subunit